MSDPGFDLCFAVNCRTCCLRRLFRPARIMKVPDISPFERRGRGVARAVWTMPRAFVVFRPPQKLWVGDMLQRRNILTHVLATACLLLAPVLSFAETGESLPDPAGPTILSVSGSVARTNLDDKAVFDRAMLAQLPRHGLDTHTSVTDGVQHFEGFLMRDLLALVGAQGETATAHALNDYIIDIPMSDFERFDVIVATEMNGKRLTARDKGPLWIVYPRDDVSELQDIRYDYRWVWQLDSLIIQ